MTTYEMIFEEGRRIGYEEGFQIGLEEIREERRKLAYEKTILNITLQLLRLGYDADTIQSLLQVDQKVIDQANLHLQRQHEKRFWF
jgi:flagellar biosynthesis/type III secretory pathway protein FliH